MSTVETGALIAYRAIRPAIGLIAKIPSCFGHIPALVMRSPGLLARSPWVVMHVPALLAKAIVALVARDYELLARGLTELARFW